MKIKKFIVYSTLRRVEHLGKKQSYIVRLVNDEGKSGLGEVCPLEGRSIESAEEALDALMSVRSAMIEGTLDPRPLPPSVMFGLTSALDDLRCESEDFSFSFTNLSLKNDPVEKGALHAKVKVSDCLVETKNRIDGYLLQNTKVRVDMNHKFSVEEVIEFVNSFAPGKLLYIEDPVPIGSLPYFIENTHVPIALDETVAINPIQSLLVHDRVTHIVVKPTLIGGMEQCRKIVDTSKAAGKKVVFSSTFESGIGLTHVLRLARFLRVEEPYGVDTIKYFIDGYFPGEDSLRLGVALPFDVRALEESGILSDISGS